MKGELKPEALVVVAEKAFVAAMHNRGHQVAKQKSYEWMIDDVRVSIQFRPEVSSGHRPWDARLTGFACARVGAIYGRVPVRTFRGHAKRVATGGVDIDKLCTHVETWVKVKRFDDEARRAKSDGLRKWEPIAKKLSKRGVINVWAKSDGLQIQLPTLTEEQARRVIAAMEEE